MRRFVTAAAFVAALACCSHSESTQNGFELEPGESRTFSFVGHPMSQVSVVVTEGKVSAMIRYTENGVSKTSATLSMSRDKAIEEVVVTGSTRARGYLEIR